MPFALLAVLVAGAVSVAPPSGCPEAAAVQAELDRLGALPALEQMGNAEVTVQGAELRIGMRDVTGASLGSRAVPAPKDCRARAALAGVVIAAWTGEWSKNRPGQVAAARTLEAGPVTPAVVSSPASGQRLHVDAAAFAFGLHDGDAGGWGGGVEVDVRGRRWGFVGIAEASSERERPLAPGTARYRFVRAGAGVRLRQQWSQLFGDVALVPEVVRYAISGAGQLAVRERVSVWQLWADLRLRVGMTLGRVSPFAYLASSWSFTEEYLNLVDREGTIMLSRANLAAGLGISVVLQ